MPSYSATAAVSWWGSPGWFEAVQRIVKRPRRNRAANTCSVLFHAAALQTQVMLLRQNTKTGLCESLIRGKGYVPQAAWLEAPPTSMETMLALLSLLLMAPITIMAHPLPTHSNENTWWHTLRRALSDVLGGRAL